MYFFTHVEIVNRKFHGYVFFFAADFQRQRAGIRACRLRFGNMESNVNSLIFRRRHCIFATLYNRFVGYKRVRIKARGCGRVFVIFGYLGVLFVVERNIIFRKSFAAARKIVRGDLVSYFRRSARDDYLRAFVFAAGGKHRNFFRPHAFRIKIRAVL